MVILFSDFHRNDRYHKYIPQICDLLLSSKLMLVPSLGSEGQNEDCKAFEKYLILDKM